MQNSTNGQVSGWVSPRVRRLAADHEAIRARFSGHEHVRVSPGYGRPPDYYEVEYVLNGLVREGDSARVHHVHKIAIRLGADYPRMAPFVEATTDVFHPNVAGHYCFGDIWTPAQTIADVIEKVGDMIQWRIFNVESALNADAAHYATEHPEIFPVGNVELGLPETEIEIRTSNHSKENS